MAIFSVFVGKMVKFDYNGVISNNISSLYDLNLTKWHGKIGNIRIKY